MSHTDWGQNSGREQNNSEKIYHGEGDWEAMAEWTRVSSAAAKTYNFTGPSWPKLIEKKRFYSSSSEESSSPPLVSHDYKKPRSENFAFIDVTDHEGVTKQSPALEMSEKLEEKLQAILTKLDKLDAIEKSVKILQETLAGMDSRIQSLESAQASAYRDIKDLKESLNFAEDKCMKTTESFDEYKQQISLQMTELEQKGTALEGKITELENKNPYLEAYSRRENIKFENIEEVLELNTRQEDTECVLPNFLESELGYKDAGSVEIQRVHRLNKKKDAKPRPIIARFLRYKDCEQILSLGHRLKSTGYRMYQDLPYGIVERRRKQMDTFKTAKRNKIPASFSKSQPDKLYIRGKLWPIGKPLDVFSH